MLNFKEGQTYICTKSNEEWWTEGQEYTVTLDRYGTPLMPDNDGYKWSSHSLNASSHQFKLNEPYSKLTPKEGQTYVCKRDKLAWWTLGKEYKVQACSNGDLYITDDDRYKWYLPNDNLLNQVFKLKENTFDLNTLTTAQLREYIGLLEDKEESERLLNDFIERMSK